MIRKEIDLVALRKSRELSQAQLAKEVGVSQATISRLEKGEYKPPLKLLVKLARSFDLQLRDVIDPAALRDVLGPNDDTRFYAFCPNPLCQANEIDSDEDGKPCIVWKSANHYSRDSYNDVNFCHQCGTELVKECPSCDRLLEHRARYCIRCGAQVTDRPTEQDWKRIRQTLESRKDEDDDIPF